METPVTQRKLARLIGVSYPTVNRALSGHPSVSLRMQKRVVEVATRLGYRKNFMASSLSTQRTYSIGVVSNNNPHSFWADLFSALEKRSRDEGYHIIFCHQRDDTASAGEEVKFLIDRGAEGIIFASTYGIGDLSSLNLAATSKTPILLLNSYSPGVAVSYLGTNSRDGARKACRYLIGLGHRRIAFVCGPEGDYTSECRLEGFRTAMEIAQLPVSPELVIPAGGWSQKHGEAAAGKLMGLSERPTAVFCANDPLAFGFFISLREHGVRVPEDISIIGYAGMKEGEMMGSPLTTVQQPAMQLGDRAAEIVVGMIDGKISQPVFEEFEDKLLVRDSCQALQ